MRGRAVRAAGAGSAAAARLRVGSERVFMQAEGRAGWGEGGGEEREEEKGEGVREGHRPEGRARVPVRRLPSPFLLLNFEPHLIIAGRSTPIVATIADLRGEDNGIRE